MSRLNAPATSAAWVTAEMLSAVEAAVRRQIGRRPVRVRLVPTIIDTVVCLVSLPGRRVVFKAGRPGREGTIAVESWVLERVFDEFLKGYGLTGPAVEELGLTLRLYVLSRSVEGARWSHERSWTVEHYLTVIRTWLSLRNEQWVRVESAC